LKYCSAFGETPTEAWQAVLEVKAAWLKIAKMKQKPIPPPRYQPLISQVA